MPSPDADWGYDVADYCGVADYGTLDDVGDLDRDDAAAAQRGEQAAPWAPLPSTPKVTAAPKPVAQAISCA